MTPLHRPAWNDIRGCSLVHSAGSCGRLPHIWSCWDTAVSAACALSVRSTHWVTWLAFHAWNVSWSTGGGLLGTGLLHRMFGLQRAQELLVHAQLVAGLGRLRIGDVFQLRRL